MTLNSSPSVLIVDDEKITASALNQLLKTMGCDCQLAEGGERALQILKESRFDVMITDLVMPGIDGFALVKRAKQVDANMAIFILTAHGSYDIARRAQTLGADDYLVKPVDPDQLQIALARSSEKKALRNKLNELGRLFENKYSTANIVGSSNVIQTVIQKIKHARHSKAPVLIRGESGTGKELVARAIYSSQAVGGGNFVTVNCPAISESLIESELFGHARGSFTGAVGDREGLFELADGGTIFLDEIGDISLQVQTKLLRILQEGELRRVGENRLRKVHVRIIAATNQNLEEAVKSKLFREDLYYRLNVIPIEIPPLRNRLEDIPELVSHFLQKHCPEGKPVPAPSPNALRRLSSYDFPGNLRELENIIQRALAFIEGTSLDEKQIEACLPEVKTTGPRYPSVDERSSFEDFMDSLRDQEKMFLENRLRLFNGNVTETARSLQLTRTALHNRIKKLGLDAELHRLSHDL